MEAKHTPGQVEVREGSYIYADDGSYIAKTTGNLKAYQGVEADRANAARIVLTWNSHDLMHQKLTDTVAWLDREIKGWDMAVKNEAREGMLECLSELRDDLAETLAKIGEGI